jgi:hypothetical protein
VKIKRALATRRILVPITLAALIASPALVCAQSVTWTFKDVTWTPTPGTNSPAVRPPLTGSFTVDAQTGALISWDITGLAHYFTSAHGSGEYVPSNGGAPVPYYDFTVGIAPDDPTRSSLLLSLPQPLPASGGTVDLYIAPWPFGAEEFCGGNCIAVGSWLMVTGSLTTLTAQYNVEINGWATIPPGSQLPLSATVTDGSGNPVSGAMVHVRVNVVPESGGHVHGVDTDPNRTGTIGVSQDYAIPSPTDSQGSVSFALQAPPASGTVEISASCDDRSCIQIGQSSTDVKVSGLVSLPPSGNYILVGQTPTHPDNHYLTPQAVAKAQTLAAVWRKGLYWLPVLAYNDASLVWGGRFDYRDADWLPPHSEHTTGVVIDVRANGTATAIPDAYGLIFTLMVQAMGGNVHVESDHYHVRLLGVAK